MLDDLKQEANTTRTENGAAAYTTTMSDCLDLFSTIGALRAAPAAEIEGRFTRAFAENPDLAMKIAFFARDVRGGLGERRAFRVILKTLAALSPAALYFISDMEFDACAENAETTNFQYARQAFEARGYRLPRVVFWNVASRRLQQPVTSNEQGVALVSGCTPRLFEMVAAGRLSPYAYMLEALSAPRYRDIVA